jgi:hypothetical protein
MNIEPAISLMGTATNFLVATEAAFQRRGLVVVNIGFKVRFIEEEDGSFASRPDAIVCYCVLAGHAKEGVATAVREVAINFENRTEINAATALMMAEEAIKRAVIRPFEPALHDLSPQGSA